MKDGMDTCKSKENPIDYCINPSDQFIIDCQ